MKFYSNWKGIKKICLDNSDHIKPEHDEKEAIGKDFTNLEVLYSIWFMKPFLYPFRKSKYMKNREYFDKYVDLIFNELDFFTILAKLKKIKNHL